MEKTSIRVTEASFIGYPAIDIERARQFYETAFNLTPSCQFENNGKLWLEYDLNGTTFAINNVSDEWKPSPDGPSVAFEVEDFEGTINELKKQNITFHSDPFETNVCHMCIVHDSEGNTLIIHKRK